MTVTPIRRPGPNDVLPCGTESARLRHLARAEACPVCGTEGKPIRSPKEAA